MLKVCLLLTALAIFLGSAGPVFARLDREPAETKAVYTETKGRIFYPLDAKEPAYLFYGLVVEEGKSRKEVTTYSEKGGKPVVVEENYFEDDKLVRTVYRQEQVQEKGELNFKGGKAVFTFTDAKGTETDSEDEQPNMILGSMVTAHLRKNWPAIAAGDTVKVRYMAIERLESIGFKFFKDKERELRGKTVLDIVMKPSSFFIAALVSPIRITVTKEEPHWIVETEGRTPIRIATRTPPKARGDWHAIDARVEYDQPQIVKAPAAR